MKGGTEIGKETRPTIWKVAVAPFGSSKLETVNVPVACGLVTVYAVGAAPGKHLRVRLTRPRVSQMCSPGDCSERGLP